jgi:tetratricopeptide (TPR) repeat protein
MLAFLFTDWSYLQYLITSPVFFVGAAFQIWMLVDAIRRKEWAWAFFIFVFSFFAAFWYYFEVYRSAPAGMRGFELPGAYDRKRIKELQAQIHHLDKPHLYSQLGDIYFHQGKLDKAEACYRSALERDPEDLDTRAHLGQCLLRQNRAAEASPMLEKVCAENPKHDYGFSLMAFAEALAALNRTNDAICVWERIIENHSYARARVQLAELYLKTGRNTDARTQLEEVLSEAPHTAAFQRRRDKVWVRQAKRLIRQTR